jgi:hypothetical protein
VPNYCVRAIGSSHKPKCHGTPKVSLGQGLSGRSYRICTACLLRSLCLAWLVWLRRQLSVEIMESAAIVGCWGRSARTGWRGRGRANGDAWSQAGPRTNPASLQFDCAPGIATVAVRACVAFGPRLGPAGRHVEPLRISGGRGPRAGFQRPWLRCP